MKYILTALMAITLVSCGGNNQGEIIASGTIEGTDINVGTEVAGRVREIRAAEGSRVSKGDTLLLIEDTEYRIQLRQALANLASFESAYRLAAKGSRKEDILQAEAAFKTAEADYLRMKDLLGSQTVTQKQYDDAYNRYVGAQQTYEKLKSGSRREEIDAAMQKRDLAAAQVELFKKKNRDCSILAPSGGTITLRAVEPGEFVTVGAAVLRITYLDKVKLMIYLSETEVGKVKLGQPASVTIDADPNRSYDGAIAYISPVAEFTPKNVQTREERTKLVFGVKVEVDNKAGALKPGLPADARIVIDQAGSK